MPTLHPFDGSKCCDDSSSLAHIPTHGGSWLYPVLPLILKYTSPRQLWNLRRCSRQLYGRTLHFVHYMVGTIPRRSIPIDPNPVDQLISLLIRIHEQFGEYGTPAVPTPIPVDRLCIRFLDDFSPEILLSVLVGDRRILEVTDLRFNWYISKSLDCSRILDGAIRRLPLRVLSLCESAAREKSFHLDLGPWAASLEEVSLDFSSPVKLSCLSPPTLTCRHSPSRDCHCLLPRLRSLRFFPDEYVNDSISPHDLIPSCSGASMDYLCIHGRSINSYLNDNRLRRLPPIHCLAIDHQSINLISTYLTSSIRVVEYFYYGEGDLIAALESPILQRCRDLILGKIDDEFESEEDVTFDSADLSNLPLFSARHLSLEHVPKTIVNGLLSRCTTLQSLKIRADIGQEPLQGDISIHHGQYVKSFEVAQMKNDHVHLGHMPRLVNLIVYHSLLPVFSPRSDEPGTIKHLHLSAFCSDAAKDYPLLRDYPLASYMTEVFFGGRRPTDSSIFHGTNALLSLPLPKEIRIMTLSRLPMDIPSLCLWTSIVRDRLEIDSPSPRCDGVVTLHIHKDLRLLVIRCVHFAFRLTIPSSERDHDSTSLMISLDISKQATFEFVQSFISQFPYSGIKKLRLENSPTYNHSFHFPGGELDLTAFTHLEEVSIKPCEHINISRIKCNQLTSIVITDEVFYSVNAETSGFW